MLLNTNNYNHITKTAHNFNENFYGRENESFDTKIKNLAALIINDASIKSEIDKIFTISLITDKKARHIMCYELDITKTTYKSNKQEYLKNLFPGHKEVFYKNLTKTIRINCNKFIKPLLECSSKNQEHAVNLIIQLMSFLKSYAGIPSQGGNFLQSICAVDPKDWCEVLELTLSIIEKEGAVYEHVICSLIRVLGQINERSTMKNELTEFFRKVNNSEDDSSLCIFVDTLLAMKGLSKNDRAYLYENLEELSKIIPNTQDLIGIYKEVPKTEWPEISKASLVLVDVTHHISENLSIVQAIAKARTGERLNVADTVNSFLKYTCKKKVFGSEKAHIINGVAALHQENRDVIVSQILRLYISLFATKKELSGPQIRPLLEVFANVPIGEEGDVIDQVLSSLSEELFVSEIQELIEALSNTHKSQRQNPEILLILKKQWNELREKNGEKVLAS